MIVLERILPITLGAKAAMFGILNNIYRHLDAVMLGWRIAPYIQDLSTNENDVNEFSY